MISNNEIISEFQSKLEKTNIEDFFIVRYDSGTNRLILVGSFDFSYYQDVELIFHKATFICCPTSIFTINKFRIASEFEIKALHKVMYGFQKNGTVFALDDIYFNTSYYIVADNVEYNYQNIKYNQINVSKGEMISPWAKERFEAPS